MVIKKQGINLAKGTLYSLILMNYINAVFLFFCHPNNFVQMPTGYFQPAKNPFLRVACPMCIHKSQEKFLSTPPILFIVSFTDLDLLFMIAALIFSSTSCPPYNFIN